MRNTKPILLVEDDQVDAMIVKRALQEIKVSNRLYLAGDGEEALHLLQAPNQEKPGLILLDLNMPRMNGIEFLGLVKQDKTLKRIPVVVLTSSGEVQDKIDSFNLGAAGYLLKPIEYKQFVEMVRTLDAYWTLSELPPEG
ncbi:MAG: response regulator [Anaerolineae bacterium]|nr:response regulator [Anaerolineae bacterium]